MWKAPGLWLCVQKAKELWFRGIFNLHSVSNKGLAVALRAVVQPDWGSGGKEGGQRRGQTGSQTSFVPPLYFSLSLFPLKSSISSLRPPSSSSSSCSQSCKCMTWGINWMGRSRGGSTESSNTSLSCSVTFIYCALSIIVGRVMCLPGFLRLLMVRCGSCGRDGSGYLHVFSPSPRLCPTLSPPATQ